MVNCFREVLSFSWYQRRVCFALSWTLQPSLDAAAIPDELQNYLICGIIHRRMISFTKSRLLSSGALCMNRTHDYLNELFEYCCPLSQHASAIILFWLFFISRRSHETELKSMMTWHCGFVEYSTTDFAADYGIVRSTVALKK